MLSPLILFVFRFLQQHLAALIFTKDLLMLKCFNKSPAFLAALIDIDLGRFEQKVRYSNIRKTQVTLYTVPGSPNT